MSTMHLISNPKMFCFEAIVVAFVVTCSIFVYVNIEKSISLHSNHSGSLHPQPTVSMQPNVHDNFYNKNHQNLEKRFSQRKHNDPLVYIRQVFIVFGSVIMFNIFLMTKLKLSRSFSEIAGWDVTIVSCIWNLIFAYAFGFVAVTYDWWFFFPDLITSHIWQFYKSQMVLGDVLFYPMAVIMGYTMILFVKRIKNPVKSESVDIFAKIIWFTIAFTVALFGITFGSTVTKGMIQWLYLPFCLAGLIFYKKYSGFELWSVTGLYVTCEFGWDAYARIKGIWIFPDAYTHPELYFSEITVFSINNLPIIWQPEMTIMSFISGMICLVFFHLSRHLLNKKDITGI